MRWRLGKGEVLIGPRVTTVPRTSLEPSVAEAMAARGSPGGVPHPARLRDHSTFFVATFIGRSCSPTTQGAGFTSH